MQQRFLTKRQVNKIHWPVEVYVAYRGVMVSNTQIGTQINYGHIFKKMYLYDGPSTDLTAIRKAHCDRLKELGYKPIFSKTTVWGRADETIWGSVRDDKLNKRRNVKIDQTRFTLLEGEL